MVLDPAIVTLIRDEIGDDLDFVDDDADLPGPEGTLGSLEDVYMNVNRADQNVLKAALIVWRKRRSAMNARSFDVAKEGNWLARSQRATFLKFQVEHYERLLRDKPKGKNATLLSRFAAES
jgi:hypothetical protein